MKLLHFLLVCTIAFSACSYAQNTEQDISQLPMYGNVKKTKDQQKSDRAFVEECEKGGEPMEKVVMGLIDTGWKHMHQDDMKTAIRRFNQAWLLDSTNVVVYASFVTYLSIKGDEAETKKMIDKTIQMNPSDHKVWDMLSSFGIVTYRKTNSTLVFDYLQEKLKNTDISKAEKENIEQTINKHKNSMGGRTQ